MDWELPSLPDAQTVKSTLRRVVIGDPMQFSGRLTKMLLTVCVGVAATGGWYLLTRDINYAASSYPVLAPIIRIATSGYTYAAVLALAVWQMWRTEDELQSRQAAGETGYSPRTVRRLQAEMQTTDGTHRAVLTTGDSVEDARERVESALDGEDDTITIERDEDASETASDDRDERVARVREIDRRLDEIHDEVEEELDRALDADTDADGVAGERVSLYDLMDSDGREAVDTADDLLEEAQELEEEREALVKDIKDGKDNKDGKDSEDTESVKDGKDGKDVSDDKDSKDLTWSEKWKLAVWDLATTLDKDRLIWQLGVPAIGVTAALVAAVGIWVEWWVYPILVSTGLSVGLANLVRVNRNVRKNVEKLRQTGGERPRKTVSALVKTVETPETTMYMGWMDGRRYASDDRDEFCEAVARNAVEVIESRPKSPSICHKYSRQIQQQYPDLGGFRENVEREKIMVRLVQAVQNSPNGLVPKQKLIEDVVEWDISRLADGRVQTGYGHDPRLVREMYRSMVPVALVETEISVETGTGSTETVTAVRLRNDPLPPMFEDIRAEFSSRFSRYAELEPRYELPDTDETDLPTWADERLDGLGDVDHTGEVVA